MAKSTRQPGEEAFPPSEVPERERLEQRNEPREFTQDQGKLAGRVQDTQIGEELEWGLPGPSEPCEPLGEVIYKGRYPHKEVKSKEGVHQDKGPPLRAENSGS